MRRIITFKSVNDFKARIASLWQDQKDNETFEFIFPDKETEDCYIDLANRFIVEDVKTGERVVLENEQFT